MRIYAIGDLHFSGVPETKPMTVFGEHWTNHRQRIIENWKQTVVPEDFKVNGNGQVYLQKKRAKTAVEYTVVVLPDALEIAKRYEYRLPKISNQKANDYLKPLQEKCGIATNLTFHKARHYYCRELLNKFKFSYEIAAKCMGHNSTKQTRHYGKVFSSTVFDAFKEIGEGF